MQKSVIFEISLLTQLFFRHFLGNFRKSAVKKGRFFALNGLIFPKKWGKSEVEKSRKMAKNGH